jgi:quercetin dioxygenase-like cupin family protein
MFALEQFVHLSHKSCLQRSVYLALRRSYHGAHLLSHVKVSIMKKAITRTLFAGVLVPGVGVLAAASVQAAKPYGPDVVSYPASVLQWKEVPGSNGIKYANVQGDLLGNGYYEAFVIFPAGRDNPFHTHGKDLPTVVLKGTFYAVVDGKRTEYPAGSYYMLPGNLKHYSGCKAGEDCLLFQWQADHFDLNEMKDDSKR